MTPSWVLAFVFVGFACLGYLATQGADFATRRMPGMRERPVAREPHAAVSIALALGTGAIGATYFARGTSPFDLGLLLLVCLTLCAACYCDLRVGYVPAALVGPVFALVIAVDLLTARGTLAVSAVIVAPFAIAAFASKGRSLGWSDVWVVALGSLVLDVSLGLLAFAIACFLAVIVAFATGRRGAPVAFAPYLTATIGLALLVPAVLR